MPSESKSYRRIDEDAKRLNAALKEWRSLLRELIDRPSQYRQAILLVLAIDRVRGMWLEACSPDLAYQKTVLRRARELATNERKDY